jgi:hypothetical protein
MRGRVAGVALAVAWLGATACSLFTDLGDYDGDGQIVIVPALDATSGDGGGAVGSEPDGSSTPSGDSGAVGDATVDSGACDATFCDDFDTPPFGASWTGKVENGGTVVGDSNALLANMGVAGTEALRTAFLYRRFAAPKKVSCTFALHPLDLSAPTEVFSFNVLAPGYKSYSLWLSLRSGQTELGVAAEPMDGGTIYDTRGVTPVAVGKWTTITMATDFTKLTLSEDGVIVKDEAFFPAVVPVHVDTQLGITFQYSKATSKVRIDDVRCAVNQ